MQNDFDRNETCMKNVIVIVNQEGWALGKTTTVVNLATALVQSH